MRKFLILGIAIVPSMIFGQIGGVAMGIIPENPTRCNMIYVTTQTYLPNSGGLVDFNVSYALDSFALSRCYQNTNIAEMATAKDTFELGYLGVGTYHISYTANSTVSPDSCESPFNSRFVTIDFYVSDSCPSLISGIENIASDDLIKVFPNPTNSQVQFSENANVQLYSITGQLVADKKNVNALDMSALASGIYTLVLADKRGEMQRTKVVKE